MGGHRHCPLPFVKLSLIVKWCAIQKRTLKKRFLCLIFISWAANVYCRKGALSTYRNIICLRTSLLFSERCYNMLDVGKVSDGNRSRFEIIAEMLRQLRIPTCRTKIMSYCNMSTAQSGHYLDLMKSSNLVQMSAHAGKVTYQRTQVGREFLELYKHIVLLLDPNVSAPLM